MGSKNFRSGYIEYLENSNAELLKRMAEMKEMYENKIFSKALNQHCLTSTLVDMLNVCTTMPEEIDLLFEKVSELTSILMNVLSKKSALVILGEKISKILDPQLRESNEQENTDDSNEEDNNNSKTGRNAGTVKVSAMNNRHSIFTEPRICLSRVSRNYFLNSKNDIQCLSPILEISSDVLSNTSNQSNDSFEDLRPSTERLNLNPACNYVSQNKDETTCIEDKELDADNENIACNDSCPNECDNEKNSKNLNNDSSGSLIGTDEESVFSAKKQHKIKKSYRTQRMSSRRCSSTKRKINSHVSDSSYEGDNEENSNEKCKNAKDSSGSSRSKPESTTKSKMLEKKAQVLLEDCMKSAEKGEKFSRSRSNASRPKIESSEGRIGMFREMKSLMINQELTETNSNSQRSKRKAAPTNLTEPKLSTKLRRN